MFVPDIKYNSFFDDSVPINNMRGERSSTYKIIHSVMGKCKSKQIGTFAEFCKSRRKKSINENSEVAVEVPFWDDAIKLLLDKIHGIAGTPISWRRLVDYVQKVFIVTGRELDDDYSMVQSFITDTLFWEYGSAWIDSDADYNYATAELGSKALVISALANEILNLVERDSGDTVAKLYMTTPPKEDLFEEGRVADFTKFAKLLRESVHIISCQDGGKTLDYVLDKISQDAGSLHLDDVLTVIRDNGYDDLEAYISAIVAEYLDNLAIELNSEQVIDPKVIEVARKQFAFEITKTVLGKITDETLNNQGRG